MFQIALDSLLAETLASSHITITLQLDRDKIRKEFTLLKKKRKARRGRMILIQVKNNKKVTPLR